MDNLIIINQNGKLLVESRQVAEMVGKEHKDLLRDIRGYMDILGKSKIALSEFFLETTYVSEQNKTLPCYLITKKGCDMVANKMTGEKGVLFTATYVTRFDEMEKQLSASMQTLSPQLQLLINMELKQQEQDKAIAGIQQDMQGIRNELYKHDGGNVLK